MIPAVRLKQHLRALALPLAVAVLAGGAFVGGRMSVGSVTEASEAAAQQTDQATVWEVTEASIGRSLTFVGEIADVTVPGPLANVDGMITGVMVDGGTPVDVGTPLIEVDLRLVVAGAGSVPAFRDLQAGDTGADVAQVRGFLCTIGRLRECGGQPTFTAAMTRAVDAWNKARGLPVDGRVRTADIMWFPSLPAVLRPAADTAVGQRITTSSRPLLAVAGAPTVKIRATRDQAALVPPGSVVRLGSRTQGAVGSVTAAPAGADGTSESADAVDITVTTADGSAGVCTASDECRELLGSRITVASEVVVEVVPAQEGIAVPVRAIQTRADDTTYVRDATGRERPVTILGSSGGMALVEGVELGDRIVVTADDDG